VEAVLASLVKELRPPTQQVRRHRKSYFRLEYRNRYPDPEKYF